MEDLPCIVDEKIIMEGHIKVSKFKFLPGEKEEIASIVLNKRPEIKVYGKIVNQCRDVSFFSNEVSGYTYSNQKAKSEKLTPKLASILERVNKHYKENYNGLLINRYNDGSEYIGAHSDNENGLGKITNVSSLSVGATRNLRIRDKISKKIVSNIPICDGDLLTMIGDFQSKFTHEIPKQLKIKLPRTSITFRYHIRDVFNKSSESSSEDSDGQYSDGQYSDGDLYISDSGYIGDKDM
jgi:alkylated DNA repair dioxygenase AlkB